MLLVPGCIFDEPSANDHMHFCFCPINKETNRCSARGIFTKEELKNVHIELQKGLEEKYGLKYQVLNGATSGGNKTIEELKAETQKKQNEEIKEQIKQQKQILNFLKNDFKIQVCLATE